MFLRNYVKKLYFTAILVTVFGIIGFAEGVFAQTTKVGFVYVGPIGDHGWTYRHHVGLKAVEKKFGSKVKTTFIEKVPEGADAVRVIRNLAAGGHDIIFTTSFGFMNPTAQIAEAFPKVKFEHATGYKTGPNFSAYNSRFYEARYLTGIIAGKMTKSNKLGYVASFPIPEVIRGINSAILGARSVNPKAEIRVVWVSTWYDPGKESDAAKALIDQGVDVVFQHTDSPAPCQTAEKKGVFCFGQASDNSHFAPKAHLTAIIDDWGPYYIERVQALRNGSWKTQNVWLGLKEKAVYLSSFHKKVPESVRSLVKKTEANIIRGKDHPFTGVIRDQNGKVLYKKGEVISDKDLSGMNFYVEGVIGKIPK